MANTTCVQFCDSLAGLSVSGVERQYDHPPERVNSADLPASFPRLVSASEGGAGGTITVQASSGWATYTVELVVLVEALELNTNSGNWDSALTMVDSVATALRSADISKSSLAWTSTLVNELVGETSYWAVVATVTGSG